MNGHLDDQMVLLLDKCTGNLPGCSRRLRYSELTDAANTHWHTSSLTPVRRFPPEQVAPS